jgi:hypothetical protein
MNHIRLVLLLLLGTVAGAQTCKFTVSGTTMTLKSDCVTSTSISVPDGFTLNGNKHLITVVDPGNSQFFAGPVITNAGPTASVKNLLIDSPHLGSCSVVEGISFNATTGSVTGNTILHIGNIERACPTGSAGIELINPVNVTVSGNRVMWGNGPALSVTCPEWPNCSGGGTVNVSNNEFTTDLNQTVVYLSGVGGSFVGNTLDADVVYNTALYLTNTRPGLRVTSNNINMAGGAATGYGIYVGSDNAVITGNRVFNWFVNESGAVGINNVGVISPATNKITNNEIRCYGTPVVNVTGSNVVLTCLW